jgi:alkylresorcinol/alkylpyrone synthase
MYLQSLATAFPPHAFTQRECFEILSQSGAMEGLRGRSRDLLQKVLTGDSGIETRRFCDPDLKKTFGYEAGALHQHFEFHAPRLASEALLKACDLASMKASGIDALLVCTCTGYLCPGLSSYISEKLGLRPNAFLETARGFLAANPDATVATIAVEISSAAFYLNDEPGVLISLCLFGDGAAAAIWKAKNQGGQLRFQNFRTIHQPEHREKIRFVNAGGRLKNQLHREVPELAAKAVAQLYDMSSNAPRKIIAHTGGRDVIEAIERAIPGQKLSSTREILRQYGNISSPSVLAALEHSLATSAHAESLWLTAFGAGFAAHSGELVASQDV